MPNISKDNMIFLSVAIALIAAVSLLVYLPQNGKLNELQTGIASQKLKLNADSMKAAIVPSLLKQTEEMKSDYKDLDRKLPKRTEIAGFLRNISSNLAEESNLINESFTPGSPSKEDLYHTLPIKMKLQGSFLSLVSFFDRINKMKRVTRVKNLKIDVNPKTDDLDVEMTLNIYFTES